MTIINPILNNTMAAIGAVAIVVVFCAIISSGSGGKHP